MPKAEDFIVEDFNDADPVIDHTVPVPTATEVRATPVGDLPDPDRKPTFSNQDVVDIITDLLSPIANEYLIERAKAIQKFLKGE